jgi:hypothetical protein
MARTLDENEDELRKSVARRWRCREDISRLSRDVINETKLIDLLLQERILMNTTTDGVPSGR